MELFYAALSQKISTLIPLVNSMGKEIIQLVSPQKQSITLQKNQDLLELFRDREDIGYFLVLEGIVEFSSENLMFLTYESNDLICHFINRSSQLRLITKSDQVKILPITFDTIFSVMDNDAEKSRLWNHYIIANMNLLNELLACFAQFKISWRYDIKTFNTGHFIIKQNDEAENAYLLLDGRADVFVNNIRTGHVEVGEVFGAIAVLTGQKRNANIIASTSCKVLDIPKSEFLKFMAYSPNLSMRIINDMANVINRLNHELTEK